MTLKDQETTALTAGATPGISSTALTRRLLTHGSWAFAGKIVAAGSSVIISALLTRLLPPTSVGAYFLSLSIVTAVALVARGGLEKTVLQMVAESLGRAEELAARSIVGRVFAIAAVTSGLVGLIIGLGGGRWLATAVFSSEPMATIAVLLAPWTIVLALEILLAETFRAFHDIPKAAIFGGALSRPLCVLGLLTVLLWQGAARLETVVQLTIGCLTISLFVGGQALLRKLRHLDRGQHEIVTAARVLRTSLPLWISNATLFVVGNADVWILGAFRPDDEVALYAVAVRLVLLVGMSLTIVNAVLPPLIGDLHARGEHRRLELVIRTTASVAAVPSIIVLLTFIVAGGPILSFAFGAFYGDAALILGLLSIGQLVNVWVGSCGYTLLMTGQQRDLMWIALVSGTVSVLGGLAAVDKFGATGVAAAVASGTTLQQLLMLWLARYRCGVWTHASPALLIEPTRRLYRRLLGSSSKA